MDTNPMLLLMQEINQRLQNIKISQNKLMAAQAALTVDTTAIMEDANMVKLLKSDTVVKYQARKHPGKEAAATRTFKISELIESILLHLPMRDLLLAQRISKPVRDAIESCFRLRRALYLEPTPTHVDGKQVIPRVNPLLQGSTATAIPIVIDGCGVPLRVEISESMPMTLYRGREECESFVVPVSLEKVDRYSDYKIMRMPRGFECDATGSWRRMLLSQPPCIIRMRVPYQFDSWPDTLWAGVNKWQQCQGERVVCFEMEPTSVSQLVQVFIKGQDLVAMR